MKSFKFNSTTINVDTEGIHINWFGQKDIFVGHEDVISKNYTKVGVVKGESLVVDFQGQPVHLPLKVVEDVLLILSLSVAQDSTINKFVKGLSYTNGIARYNIDNIGNDVVIMGNNPTNERNFSHWLHGCKFEILS